MTRRPVFLGQTIRQFSGLCSIRIWALTECMYIWHLQRKGFGIKLNNQRSIFKKLTETETYICLTLLCLYMYFIDFHICINNGFTTVGRKYNTVKSDLFQLPIKLYWNITLFYPVYILYIYMWNLSPVGFPCKVWLLSGCYYLVMSSPSVCQCVLQFWCPLSVATLCKRDTAVCYIVFLPLMNYNM